MKQVSYNIYRLSPKEKRDCAVISYVILFLGFYVFYQSLTVSLASGIFVPVCMRYYAGSIAEKRKELLITQFRDFLYSLQASFSAGRNMRDGLYDARENLRLMYDEKSPMIAEISAMLNKIDNIRTPVEEALKDFAARCSVSDIENFVEIYSICRLTGGDISAVISKTSNMLMDKIGIEKEIKTLTSQKRFEGKLISAMPVVVILFLNIASPGYVEVLYTTLAGRVIMTGAMAGILYAYHLTLKLTRIEV